MTDRKKLTTAVTAAFTAGLLAVAIAGCGGSSSKTSTATTPSTTAPATAPAPSTTIPTPKVAIAPSPAKVGATLVVSMTDSNYNDVSANVTLVKIADPAQGADQYTTPDSGKRFVGAEFQIVAQNSAVSDNANNDATLVGSDNQTYDADMNSIAEGTNFNMGDVNLAAGQSSTGWVTFQVPTGVSVASVLFGDSSGTVGTWDVSTSSSSSTTPATTPATPVTPTPTPAPVTTPAAPVTPSAADLFVQYSQTFGDAMNSAVNAENSNDSASMATGSVAQAKALTTLAGQLATVTWPSPAVAAAAANLEADANALAAAFNTFAAHINSNSVTQADKDAATNGIKTIVPAGQAMDNLLNVKPVSDGLAVWAM
jgi:Domain of unknown function (DUF4352)